MSHQRWISYPLSFHFTSTDRTMHTQHLIAYISVNIWTSLLCTDPSSKHIPTGAATPQQLPAEAATPQQLPTRAASYAGTTARQRIPQQLVARADRRRGPPKMPDGEIRRRSTCSQPLPDWIWVAARRHGGRVIWLIQKSNKKIMFPFLNTSKLVFWW
jgi:hypothetical protein